MKTLIIFQHAVNTENVYCWNGEWPVGILPNSDAWNGTELFEQAGGKYGTNPLTEEEKILFEDLALNKKQTFALKNRGKFNILKRIKIETDDKN